jgi:hypothetical protein
MVGSLCERRFGELISLDAYVCCAPGKRNGTEENEDG